MVAIYGNEAGCDAVLTGILVYMLKKNVEDADETGQLSETVYVGQGAKEPIPCSSAL